MQKQRLSIGSAIDFGWEQTKKHFWFLALVVVITMVIGYLPGIVGDAFDEDMLPMIVIVFLVIGAFFMWIAQMLVSVGLVRISLSLVDGKKPKLGILFDNFGYFLNYLAASILYGLATLGGLLFFVVPGIIFWVRFQFYSYAVVEEHASPIAALKRSWSMTRGVTWQVILLNFAMIGINLIGVLLLGVGLLWSIPVSFIGMAHVYRQLRKNG